MKPELIDQQLENMHQYFVRSTSALKEEDSGFAPKDGMYTAAALVAHVAQTIDWFFEGAFRAEGFDLDFEGLDGKAREVTSLKAAREWVDRSFHQAREIARSKSAEEWAAPIADGPIMGGAPRVAILSGLEDHTAHHRGALSVYARLLGHVPPMPYMDAEPAQA